mmetsp:Transcript_32468/g.87163  ORF Transcript_32468/g.87163 Transcript_32468/m.87163 type:complete len:200 (+) Transcript_32468:1144-1743(+)
MSLTSMSSKLVGTRGTVPESCGWHETQNSGARLLGSEAPGSSRISLGHRFRSGERTSSSGESKGHLAQGAGGGGAGRLKEGLDFANSSVSPRSHPANRRRHSFAGVARGGAESKTCGALVCMPRSHVRVAPTVFWRALPAPAHGPLPVDDVLSSAFSTRGSACALCLFTDRSTPRAGSVLGLGGTTCALLGGSGGGGGA